jgi:hypothetical protein
VLRERARLTPLPRYRHGDSHASGSPGGQTLTVDNANAYDGSVTSAPAGISCGSRCTATFAPGSTVTLTAAPREENAFSGFHGDCAAPPSGAP